MEATVSGGSRVLALIPRVGAIVSAVILLAMSAATIGIINSNFFFVGLSDHDAVGTLPDNVEELLALINGSLGAAGWLIVMTTGVVIVEIIVIVIVVINVQGTVKLIFGIIEIFFSIAVILSYLATGILCAMNARAWAGPPDVCPDPNDKGVGDICDSVPLTVTNALQAVFCFIQVGAFGDITTLTGRITGRSILNLMKSRTQST